MTQVRWSDMTFEEVGAAAASGAVAVLPVGATEQHGPHLITGTDTFFAEGLCIDAAAQTGDVVLPPLARAALDRYLVQRGLPVTPSKWRPSTTLVGSLGEDGSGISSWRLWRVLKRFFATAAEIVEEGSPALAEKLRQATPHWTRHTHATHLLEGGAELTTVRDNLRHASLATTSMYLHTDDARRAKQVADRFAAPRS